MLSSFFFFKESEVYGTVSKTSYLKASLNLLKSVNFLLHR